MTAMFGQVHHDYRVRFKEAGGHVHLRVFSRRAGQETWAKCGDLTISASEVTSFQRAFGKAEFLEEDF